MTKEDGQPVWRIRVFFPTGDSSGNTDQLKLATFGFTENGSRFFELNFDDPDQAFKEAEKLADADRIVVVLKIDWKNKIIDVDEFWILPWATEWIKEFGWDLSSFIDLRIHATVLRSHNKQQQLNLLFSKLSIEAYTVFQRFGPDHFRQMYYSTGWLGG